MLTARPQGLFEAVLSGIATGLTGHVGVRITRQRDSAVVVERTTAGVAEFLTGSGGYSVALTAPAELGEFCVRWDVGEVDVSAEPLMVNLTGPAAYDSDYTPTIEEVAALLRTR